MSGFDFDELRDANAPKPGDRQRARVHSRAHQLRGRARRNRFLAGATSLAVMAAIVLGVAASTRSTEPSVTVEGPTTSTSTQTSTTATTAPVVTRSSAVSATFVSPQRGWLLERSGTVLGTTDGGESWHAVGSLGRTGSDRQIRFASATRGYSYSVVPQTGAPLLATDDGGAHWTTLTTPFASPFALAISRGIVYAVAMQPSDANFRIWSSPAEAISWKEDPLAIGVNAGPVPQIQLVFAGNQGWLVEVDRVVAAGARLGPKGHWSAWTPPCTGVNGPAELAASTSNDLFASCQEGVWGPPKPATALYVSHDGGATFVRHSAPISGEVASPDPDTAVVFDTGTVQRSTDDGVSWHAVAKTNDGAYRASDLGFTTTTQGFAIDSNGKLLMTHDGGAHWKSVTLP